MLNKLLKTPVDVLVEEVKKNKIISLTDLQKKLHLPLSILERWLIILEEYKIIKTTYKGLEGFVQIIEKEKKSNEPEIEEVKLLFIDKCKERGLSFDEMKTIWPSFLSSHIKDIKDEFQKSAMKKGYDPSKVKQAWIKFEKDLKRF